MPSHFILYVTPYTMPLHTLCHPVTLILLATLYPYSMLLHTPCNSMLYHATSYTIPLFYYMSFHTPCDSIQYATQCSMPLCHSYMPYHSILIPHATSNSMPVHTPYCLMPLNIPYYSYTPCYSILHAILYAILYHTICHTIPFYTPYYTIQYVTP